MNLESLVEEVSRLPAKTDAQQGLVGLGLGIIYALRRAGLLGFVARTGAALGPDYTTELSAATSSLGSGQEPPREWLAGFFFNSAIVRIAAGSHRAFRMLYGVRDGTFCELANRAVGERKVREEDISLLRECYRDVNDFKHEVAGALLEHRRITTLQQGIDAAMQLLRLIKAAV